MTIEVTVELKLDCRNGSDALAAVNAALDTGVFQDAIHDYEDGKGPVSVHSVVAS